MFKSMLLTVSSFRKQVDVRTRVSVDNTGIRKSLNGLRVYTCRFGSFYRSTFDRTGVRNGLKSLRIDTCRFTMYIIGGCKPYKDLTLLDTIITLAGSKANKCNWVDFFTLLRGW